jgi:hypothetical protein
LLADPSVLHLIQLCRAVCQKTSKILGDLGWCKSILKNFKMAKSVIEEFAVIEVQFPTIDITP